MRISDWSSDVCSSDLLIARFGLGDGDLPHAGGHHAHDPELGDVAAIFVQALAAPGADHAGQPTAGDGVIFLYEVAMRLRVEQGERAFEEIGRASCRERVCPYV